MFSKLKNPPSLRPKTFKRTVSDCLPLDVQCRIWKYSVPDPRDIQRGIIPLVINFDLGRPRAIVPRERLFKEAHGRLLEKFDKLKGMARWNRRDELQDPDPRFWEMDNSQMRDLRKPLDDLLGFSAASKRAVEQIYCFEDDLLYTERTKALWKESDVVWIPEQRVRLDDWVMKEWSNRRTRRTEVDPYASFKEIRHLAVSREHLEAMVWHKSEDGLLGIIETFFDRRGRFLKLETVKLFLDPNEVREKQSGTIRLRRYAETIPEGSENRSGFTHRQMALFVSYWNQSGDDVLKVEVCVMEWKMLRKNWCQLF